jgi:peptidoglycan pentaglycine glycine transferase (the first glycine)
MSEPSQLRTVASTLPAGPDAAWDAWVQAQPAAHLLQTSRWAELKARFGWQPRRVVVQGRDGGVCAGGSLLLRRTMGLTMAYVPRGPLVDWHDATLVAELLGALRAEARRGGAAVLKLEPEMADSGAHRALLAGYGLTPSRQTVQPPSTIVVDIGRSEEAILQGMKSKWRYNVRLAEKRGICVRSGSEADLPAFYALYAETGGRDGFLIRPFDYYDTTWRTFLAAQADPASQAGGALLLAEHPEESQPLAGVFLLRYGTQSWYFYGASGDRRRRDMPNYLLQWEALRWSIAQGCTRYDWWGAPTDPDDAGDSMQGVWQFKQGFGAELQRQIGAWDFPVSATLYRLYTETMPSVLHVMRRVAR